MEYTLLGQFAKGTAGSVTINFAPSGGLYCADSCSMKGLDCYAETVEGRKPSVTVNLERKAADLSGYLTRLSAPSTLRKLTEAPWTRVSAFGSVPPAPALTPSDRTALRTVAAALDHSRVHLPVETHGKVRTYAALGFAPQLSLGRNPRPDRVASTLKNNQHCSLVYDPGYRGPAWTKVAKRDAKTYAWVLRHQHPDQKIVVCPAIVGSAKCGECKACGSNGANLVIFPIHR